MSDSLATYLYQYGVGGLIFLTTLVWVWRTGMLGPSGPVRRRRVWYLTGGFALYGAVHAAWHFLLP